MKEKIKEHLLKREFDRIVNLGEPSKIVRTLISISYDKTQEIAWRSIEAIGHVVYIISKERQEFGQELIRRLLWSIRDEAGGIGWSSPEIIGEIVKNEPSRYQEIPRVLWSFMDEEFLRKGIIWAMGRIGEVSPESVEFSMPFLRLIAQNDRDEEIRFYALWALCKMGEDISIIKGDLKGEYLIYDDGRLRKMVIDELKGCVNKKSVEDKDAPERYGERQGYGEDERYFSQKGSLLCPFCNSPVDRPSELRKGFAEVLGGRCRCGALYAYDPSGRALGETLIDGLAILCNGDYNKALTLEEGKDYIMKFFLYEPYVNRLSGYTGSITARRMIFIKTLA